MTGNSQKMGQCGLCLEDNVVLQNSHLIPRAVYKKMTKRAEKNSLITFTDNKTVKRPNQIKKYFLCQTCEQLFNNNGEQWLGMYAYNNGSFLLRDILKKASPFREENEGKYFNGNKVLQDRGIDKLTYFAVSVFWRAAATEWKDITDSRQLCFGPYKEKLRQYLLELCDFPKEAALFVYISESDNSAIADVLNFPVSHNDEGNYHDHSFMIPGMRFHLLIGKKIPKETTQWCAIHSEKRVITLTKTIDDFAVDQARQILQ